MTWPPSRCIFSNMREAELHQRGAGQLRLDDLRIDRRADVGDVDQPRDAHVPGLGVDLDLDAGAGRPSRTASRSAVWPVARRAGCSPACRCRCRRCCRPACRISCGTDRRAARCCLPARRLRARARRSWPWPPRRQAAPRGPCGTASASRACPCRRASRRCRAARRGCVSAGMLSTSPTICAMAVSEPCPMSTVPQ